MWRAIDPYLWLYVILVPRHRFTDNTYLHRSSSHGKWIAVPNKDISVKARSNLADAMAKTEKTCRLTCDTLECDAVWKTVSEGFCGFHDDVLGVEDWVVGDVDRLRRVSIGSCA